MPLRTYPEDYFEQEPQRVVIEQTLIPTWVPVLLAIALIGAFAVALYALSLNKKEKPVQKEYTPLVF